jgi:diguanylate cyclase (GGDEF)-like protein
MVELPATPHDLPVTSRSRAATTLYLNLLAGLITLGILAFFGYTVWADRLQTLEASERASRNILTAITRDLTHDFHLIDLSLKGVAEGLRHPELHRLPPDLQQRVLFDRSVSASMLSSLLALDEAGNTVADSSSPVAPSQTNYADRDYFQVHRDNPQTGLYISHPYQSRRRAGEFSIAASRRLSHHDGQFAGAVVSGISLSNVQALFKDLDLGKQGVLNLYRDDGILLTRQPFDAKLIGSDQSRNPNIQRLLRERSGTIDVVSQIDGVRRLVTFERLTEFPLLLTVAVSVDEALAPWRTRAVMLGLVTLALCSAILALVVLFQRQLRLRAETEAELSRLAATDALTQLPNRRAFDDAFGREWRQAMRSGLPLSVLYIDADHFKSFNDLYGHGRGDELLVLLGRTIKARAKRPRDLTARYGGEEFVVLLPETDLVGAARLAESIREGVADLAVAHQESSHGVATVSIGVATQQPSVGDERDALLKAADAALYEAKALGRNRIHAPDESSASRQTSRLVASA